MCKCFFCLRWFVCLFLDSCRCIGYILLRINQSNLPNILDKHTQHAPVSFTSNPSGTLAIMALTPKPTKNMPILSSTSKVDSTTTVDYRPTSSTAASKPSNGGEKIPIRIGNLDGRTRPMRRRVPVAMVHIMHPTRAISNC
jgi:hypothetical protein